MWGSTLHLSFVHTASVELEEVGGHPDLYSLKTVDYGPWGSRLVGVVLRYSCVSTVLKAAERSRRSRTLMLSESAAMRRSLVIIIRIINCYYYIGGHVLMELSSYCYLRVLMRQVRDWAVGSEVMGVRTRLLQDRGHRGGSLIAERG